MYVKQVHAEWIGISNGEYCTNGVCTFKLDDNRKAQLVEYEANISEIRPILVAYKVRNCSDFHGFTKQMESDLIELGRKSKRNRTNGPKRGG